MPSISINNSLAVLLTDATSMTQSFTVNAGSQRALLVNVIPYGGTITSITYNGVALSLLSGTWYWLASPPVGTFNLVINKTTYTFTAHSSVQIVAVNSVDQSSPIITLTSMGSSGTSNASVNNYALSTTTRNALFLHGYTWNAYNATLDVTQTNPSYGTAGGGSLLPNLTQSSISTFPGLNCGATGYISNTASALYTTYLPEPLNSNYAVGMAVNQVCGVASTFAYAGVLLKETLPQPIITSNDATNITDKDATLEASVNGNGYATTTYIQFGTVSGTYTTVLSSQTGSTGASTYSQAITANSLAPNTTYYCQTVCNNGNGILYGTEFTFTTLPSPVVSTTAASLVGSNTGTLNSLITSANRIGTYHFDYGYATGVYPNATPTNAITQTTSPTPFSYTLNGLSTGITVYYRINATINGTNYLGTEQSFYTSALPQVVTNGAVSLTNSATLYGIANPEGLTTNAFFQYGTTTALGSTTPTQNIGNGVINNSFSATLNSLALNTRYYYRAAATNSNGTGNGTIYSFTTGGLPTIDFGDVTKNINWNVTSTINPNSQDTMVHFDYGTTSAFGQSTVAIDIGNGNTNVNVSQDIFNLLDNTTYYIRCVAVNASGTVYSSTVTFDTGTQPVPFAPTLTITSSLSNLVSIDNTLQYGTGTFLSRDSVNNATIYVENSTYLNGGRYLVGVLGAENAEIATVNSVTAPSPSVPSTVTLASVLNNRHSFADPITYITFDQVEISSSPTQNGLYSVLATIPIQVNSDITIFHDLIGTNTTYYKARFFDSYTGNYSAYSDSISTISLSSQSAGYMFAAVRKTLGIKLSDTQITDEFLLGALNEARQIMDREFGAGIMKEWRFVGEYPIKMLAGTNYVNLPVDVDYTETNRAVVNARYSNNSVGAALPIEYIDKNAWNVATYQRRYTTCQIAANTGATSLYMVNTGDFPSAGAIQMQAENFNQSILTVSYTGNDVQNNILTGCTGITRPISVGSQGWAYQTQAYPINYTVFNNSIYFDSVVPIIMNGKNLYIDYYKALVDIVSINDIIPEHYRDIYKDYLRFAIKRRRDNSIGEDDPDYQRFQHAGTAQFANSYLGQMIRIQ